uniref:Isocitrate dehydrogenase [NAD] subunit, mitochondrial n=1 Tax=Callorhinchus milii TaxID=7868 RepID=V9KZ06_CALMI
MRGGYGGGADVCVLQRFPAVWSLLTSRMLTTSISSPLRSPTPQAGAVPGGKPDGNFRVTMIPGDGVGSELMQVVKEVFKAAAVPVEFDEHHVSEVQNTANEETMSNLLTSMRANRVAIKGKIYTPMESKSELASFEMQLRRELDLFANVVHVKSLPGYVTRHNNLDLVIIREQTEGEYSSLEYETVTGVIECLKIITREKSRRIAKFAFDYATKKGRSTVTAVHKANIMKLGDGLFLQCCKEVASGFPDITFDSMIIDNTTMQLVSRPQQFDVMLMPNLYGNVVSNVCAGLVGGAGLPPGANYGRDYAVFETGTRNTGKSIANKNIANPTAMLLASCLMLDHLKLHDYAALIRSAIMVTMNEHRLHTRDIGGMGTTLDVVQGILQLIQVNSRFRGSE